MRIPYIRPLIIPVITLFFVAQAIILASWAQVLDKPEMPPLVDTRSHAGTSATPPKKPAEEGPFVLQGAVKRLDAAIEEEQTIDWYKWYLSARSYLSETGGLNCELGTQIKFYKQGRIEALTSERKCLENVEGRRFPLPQATSLSAVVLPVRPAKGPPASPQELIDRIRNTP